MRVLVVVIILTLLFTNVFTFQQPNIRHNKISTRRYASDKVQVEFLPANKLITANIGEKLSDVALRAQIEIQYKCKKGECGTCQVQINGKWVKACQTIVPTTPTGVNFAVTVKPAVEKKKAAFFSPQSFLDGVVNNGLGVVGFISEASKVDDEFKERMEREARIAAKVEAAKKAKAQGL